MHLVIYCCELHVHALPELYIFHPAQSKYHEKRSIYVNILGFAGVTIDFYFFFSFLAKRCLIILII